MQKSTFSISSSRNKIVQPTVVASDCALFAWATGLDQVPNKRFNLLVALVSLQTEQ